MEQVIIGVDPHKLSATIEVVDRQERLLGSGRFTTDKAGYTAMRNYVKGGGTGSGRSRAPTVRVVHWPSDWWRPASRSLTCRPSSRPGSGCSTPATTARPTPGCPLDRDRRGPHRRAAGSRRRRRAGGAADAHRPSR